VQQEGSGCERHAWAGFRASPCVGDQRPCTDVLNSWLLRKLRIVRHPQPRVRPRGSHAYPATHHRKRPYHQVCHACAHTHATLHARVVLPLQTASTRPPCVSHPRRTMRHPEPRRPYRPSSTAHPRRTMPVPGTPKPSATPSPAHASSARCRSARPWLTSPSTIPVMPEISLKFENFVDLGSGACLGVLARLICTMCMDNLMYRSGGKKVVNNETE